MVPCNVMFRQVVSSEDERTKQHPVMKSNAMKLKFPNEMEQGSVRYFREIQLSRRNSVRCLAVDLLATSCRPISRTHVDISRELVWVAKGRGSRHYAV